MQRSPHFEIPDLRAPPAPSVRDGGRGWIVIGGSYSRFEVPDLASGSSGTTGKGRRYDRGDGGDEVPAGIWLIVS